MKVRRTNTKQIARNIANICFNNPEKEEQLEKVQDICFHLTSDDGISVETEIYADGIVRYLITGTRCNMTITAKEPEHKVIRKPRGISPAFISWDHMHVSDIQDALDDIKEFHARLEA